MGPGRCVCRCAAARWAGLLCVPVGGGPPARSPHASLRLGASPRSPARPRHHPRAPQPGPTTNFACNSVATLSNHEVTALELQRFHAVLNLRPVELPAELVEPIPSTTHTPSKDVVGFTKVPQSPDTGTSSFTTRRVE